MQLSTFEDLLNASRRQSEPQRLLFVFVGAEIADDSTPEQRARFQSGEGGSLVPLMSVAKEPAEMAGFAELELEARQFGKDWVMVFVAALSGRNGAAPGSDETTRALDRMMVSIQAGSLEAFMAFDRRGEPVVFT